jgi:acyl-coenzyme A thioesterase PaaI-like protein
MSSTKQDFLAKRSVSPRLMRWLMNCWPPLIGAGIHIVTIADDWRYVKVRLRHGLHNRNYVGTAFGGSLFAMTDPFYMIMFSQLLGRDYLVWDKAGSIQFLKPGRDTMYCELRVDEAMLADAKAKTADGAKYEPTYAIDVIDRHGTHIAKVEKTLYIRRKETINKSTKQI